ncbi:MAG TPA: SRPBCC domain-containing protein, partial [Mycobacterium sp.]|nr:SRPBCC domain-containing protein [Mycobacterium sp.]
MPTSTDYRTTVRVNAPADVVFDAVTTTEALTAWWSPVTGSGLTGGELRFPMVENEPPLLLRVDEATRPTTVRWTVIECTFMEDWVGTQPTFTIRPLDADSCELTFEHRGLNDELDCKDMC